MCPRIDKKWESDALQLQLAVGGKVEDEVVISEKILRSTNLSITLSEKSTCRILRDTFNKKLKEITADKNKMGELLYRVYEEYKKQNEGFPALQ